jgi:hypothetical protein
LSSPYECLREIHGIPGRGYRRTAVKFVAEVERFTDPGAEGVIVRTGQDPIARKVARAHFCRLQGGPSDVLSRAGTISVSRDLDQGRGDDAKRIGPGGVI